MSRRLLDDRPVSDEVPLDRAAALASGPPKVPRPVVFAAVACVALLGLGGVALDRFFPGPAGSPAALTPATTAGDYPPPFEVAPPGRAGGAARGSGHDLTASRAALMGLQKVTPVPAPNFSLLDSHGHPVSLSGFRGDVVVLTFFDSACNDICPVLEAEIKRARADLAGEASRVYFLTVNTDPLGLSLASARPAEAGPLSPAGTWEFLTGTLSQLDRVWRAYGIAVEVQRSSGTVAHNEDMYFIGADGRVRYRATPFADETHAGLFNLAHAAQASWAEGIAAQARYLLRSRP